MAKENELVTTGKAAEICSVTPDTVLKWIRSGYLPARRTAGGHHRIDRHDLERVLRPSVASKYEPVSTTSLPHRPNRSFLYCWEFYAKGAIMPRCRDCSVYSMRAQRCYEVARQLGDDTHSRLFCQGHCENCDYFREVHEQATNVLVVTDDSALAGHLRSGSQRARFNLETADCEYNCSALICHFKPDFAIVDCSLGKEQSQDITFHLKEDPRIPFIRVVLAGRDEDFPTQCKKEVFARIKRPFTVDDINECIAPG